MDRIRWGILSTGNIAHSFTQDLKIVERAEVVAVGSRTQASADAFAERYQIPHAHAGYQGLADDPDVDVIYIGTPHTFHYENTLMCLEAGKHVLCEKPFAMNARQTREMINLARRKNLFLMEAWWTRFLPATIKLLELLPQIGPVRSVMTDFGFYLVPDPTHRIFAKSLGGGSLLDVGIYPVAFAMLILGKPDQILTSAHMGETGVDVNASYIFHYNNGSMAVLHSSLVGDTAQDAHVTGEKGRLTLPTPFWMAGSVELARGTDEVTVYQMPTTGKGYSHEAAEVMRCIREGRIESKLHPLSVTLDVMEVMDSIRAEWGLVYEAD
ncbi:MAG: Gfo/Idh/MocA family oxidoreductase [Chloroflexi bacterium]|nr:Gfo/Idh/MocA family oxidoreductase [Chloroflexota bacterium]